MQNPTAVCGGTYDVCCDEGDSIPVCRSTAHDCECNPQNPTAVCVGIYDVCCDPAGTGQDPTCQSTSNECECNPNSPSACQSPYDVCCNKGQGRLCYSNNSGCI